jgi:MOSC domain-containing protein YiiM
VEVEVRMASPADRYETNGGRDSFPRRGLVGVILVRGDEVLFGLPPRRPRRRHLVEVFSVVRRAGAAGPGGEGVSALSVQSERALPPRGDALPPVSVGSVEAIHIAAAAGAPVRLVDEVRAIAGVGLEGDRYADGRGHYQDARVSRDLTLIEAEAVEALAREHGIALASGETRRNLTTRGLAVNDLVGQRFWVGDVLCLGTSLCEPCQYLADLTGRPLLRPLVHRGGLRADIVHGGVIRIGDRVHPDDETER